MDSNQSIPKGTRVLLDRDKFSDMDTRTLTTVMFDEHVWDTPMTVMADYHPDHSSVLVDTGYGEHTETHFYPKTLKLYKSREEVLEELLRIKEEIGG